MTITLRPGSTVVFAGESTTDCQRLPERGRPRARLPLRIAGEWGPRRPVSRRFSLKQGVVGIRPEIPST
ncbi:hypothetical protein [Nonomuraea sp. NPDC050643]|uniref:hypothetical protein n=1 Tax=Nonomuraea sp. NPDC050643 TaxID=3155660 RepID=UPI0033CA8754